MVHNVKLAILFAVRIVEVMLGLGAGVNGYGIVVDIALPQVFNLKLAGRMEIYFWAGVNDTSARDCGLPSGWFR